MFTAVLALLGVIVGAFLSSYFTFRRDRASADAECISPIIDVALGNRNREIDEFNAALHRVWLYGSRKTARAIEVVLADLAKGPEMREHAELPKMLQRAIPSMRQDVQFLGWLFWWRRLKPEEITHFHFQ